MTAATDSTDEVHALLCPQVTNILLAFTENSLCYQIHCAAGQITRRQLSTPAQILHVLSLNHHHLSDLSSKNW